MGGIIVSCLLDFLRSAVKNIFVHNIIIGAETLAIMICIFIVSIILSNTKILSRFLSYIASGSSVMYFFHRQFFEVCKENIGEFSKLQGYLLILPLLIFLSWLIQKIIKNIRFFVWN